MSEIEKLRKELFKAETKGQQKDAAALCNCIGQELCKLNRYKEALDYHEKELQYCIKVDDQLGIAVANRRIGECYSELNDFKKALHYQKIFLDIAVQQNSLVEEQRALATLGRTYYLKYLHELADDTRKCTIKINLDKAEQAFTKALELSQHVKKLVSPKEYAEMRARLFLNLGLVNQHRGNFVKCAESIQHAIFLTKRFNLFEDLYRCQHSLATVYQQCEQYNCALRLLDESASSAKLLQDKALICEALSAKAHILLLLKDFEGARTYLKKAYKKSSPVAEDKDQITKQLAIVISICKCKSKLLKVKDDFKVRKPLLEKIADGLATLGCFKLAIEYYFSTLECLEKMNVSLSEKSEIYFSLAQTYADDGNYDKAIEYYKIELQCNKDKPIEKIKTLWKLAELSEEKERIIAAKGFYTMALDIAESLQDRKQIFCCLKRLHNYCNNNQDEDLTAIAAKLANFDEDNESLSDDNVTETEQQFNDNVLDDLSDTTDSDVEKEMCDNRPKRRIRRPEMKKNELGETLLHKACINGNLNKVKELVENGHPVNERDNCGWLPLHEACNHGHYEIVDYLIKKGALINDRGGTHCDGITPLHDAASCGNLDVMELLLSKGASVVTLNNAKEMPLDSFIKWWKNCENDLDLETRNQCIALEVKLKTLMKHAGQDVADERNVKNNPEPSTLKTQEKRCYSPKSSSSDEDPYLNPHINWKHDVNNFTDAKSEYKNAISQVRKSAQHPQSNIDVEMHDKPHISALLSEENVVHDWLIKDTNNKPRMSRKKRRVAKPSLHKTNHNIRDYLNANESDSSGQSSSPIPNIDLNTDIENENVEDDLRVSHEKLTSSMQRNNSSKILCKTVEETPQSNICCIHVHIGDKVILVPITHSSNTIEWLSEEASSRYQQLTGSKPHLSLMNKDGAILASSDLIRAVLQNNERVLSTVNSWNKLSLLEAYLKVCEKEGLNPVENISKRLLMAENSLKLNISELSLTSVQSDAIFTSFHHAEKITHLNINHIDIDAHLTTFLACVPSLVSVIILSMSCCGLMHDSMTEFCQFLSSDSDSSKYFPKLKHMVLSHNSFENLKAGPLSVLLKLPSLESLDISACGLCSDFFMDKKFQNMLFSNKKLNELNASSNDLQDIGISQILSHLPRDNLVKLDLSHTVKDSTGFMCYLQNFMSHSLPYLEELHLEGCYLQMDDLLSLCKSIAFCPKLSIINLSANPGLSAVGFVELLKSALHFKIPVKVLQATGCCQWLSRDIDMLKQCFHSKCLLKIQIDNVSKELQRELYKSWQAVWGKDGACTNNIFLFELYVNRHTLT